MERDYLSSYKELNKEQKLAVDTTDGPVLVLAGPGTGKTQLLSLRVANILKKTDTDASSILCLTFTNFAATNMRERLNRYIGSSAHNVKVQTFHSFASDIMQNYPDYFWNGAALSVVPDALQLEIIQEILADLPLADPLASKFAGNYTAISDVIRALSLTKEAGLTPSKLQAMIEVNQTYIDLIEPKLAEISEPSLSLKKLDQLESAVLDLPDQPIDQTVRPLSSLSRALKEGLKAAIEEDKELGKTTNTGKWKKSWIQTVEGQKGMFEERKRNNWWLSLSRVYAIYRSKLHSLSYYDYSDMIVEVISTLEQNPDLLSAVQERYLYVLIDEFQDTNSAQLRLSDLVSNSPDPTSNPNLMVVGDDDQTIFGFNGAELNNSLNFIRNYPDLKVIVLTQNYRSDQSILDMAEQIIDQSDDRLVRRMPEFNKKLSANKSFKGEIVLRSYPTVEHELYYTALSIKETWQKSPASSIAVLARNHDSLMRLSDYLHKEQVPISYEKQNNVLDQELIIQMELLARTINSISSGDLLSTNVSLSRLIQHPVWHFDPEDLWQMATANFSRNSSWLDSLLESKDDRNKSIGTWLTWLARESSYQPLTVMMEYMLGLRAGEPITSPIKEHFLHKKTLDTSYLEGLSALETIKQQLREFIGSSNEPKLSDLIRFIDLSRSLNRPIVDESWFISHDQTVELMTIHKAKGLEFDSVFLIGANESNWNPKRLGRKPPANLPLQPYGEHFDDYARLAYVAATRARSSFYVSAHDLDYRGQKLILSPLFSRIKQADIKVSDKLSVNILEKSLSWPRLETNSEKSMLSPRLEDYRLSATAFIRFLDLSQGGPEYFLERELLKLPEPSTDSMAFGTAIHSALQAAQLQVNNDKFDLNKVVDVYQSKLQSLQLTQSSLDRYLAHGANVLISLFEDKGFELPKSGQPEVSFSEVNLDTVRLNGVLDHVYVDHNKLVISDYKTGNTLSSFYTKDQTKVIKAWRQKTQLLYYCLLARQSGRFKSITEYEGQIIYVESENSKGMTLSLKPTNEELDQLEHLIKAVWQRIQNLDFSLPSGLDDTIDSIQKFQAYLINQ